MNKRLTALLIAVVALMVLGGIPAMAAPSAAPAAPNEVRVSQADSGRQIQISGSQLLVVNLDSNPSTGYGWQIQGLDQAILRQVGEDWTPSSGLLGAPGTTILRFAGVAEGQTTLQLAYQRPWEKGVAALNTFSLVVDVKSPAPVLSSNMPAPASQVASGGVAALPASYNWCNNNGCTSVRDQGNCGSCWAFGTVGAFESAIKIHDGLAKDLSEQYLVSCNTDGWGCNGGWWAHDYHQWKIPPSETAAGAVYEADFRYQARDVACNGPYTHHEKLSNWSYVGGQNSVPSVDAIKNAIYTYGPVAAAVCVDSRFQAYTSGVFVGSTSCRSTNHAIVLVGWDDAGQYWILRNSWGSSWGEQGYMRIAWGTTKVGYAATYVEYGGGTPPPAGTMHVSAIDMSYTKKSSNVTVNAAVTIVDSNNAPVPNATVSVRMTLPGGTTKNLSGITGTNGKVTLSVRTKLTGTYTATVTNVTHASYTYDPNANVITTKSIVVP